MDLDRIPSSTLNKISIKHYTYSKMLLKKKKNCKKCENIFDGLSTGFADGRERGELLHPDIRLNANSLINLNILNYSKFIF